MGGYTELPELRGPVLNKISFRDGAESVDLSKRIPSPTTMGRDKKGWDGSKRTFDYLSLNLCTEAVLSSASLLAPCGLGGDPQAAAPVD